MLVIVAELAPTLVADAVDIFGGDDWEMNLPQVADVAVPAVVVANTP